jgi:Icc-related predicted phosphoesterase
MQILLISDIRGELNQLHELIERCKEFSLDAVCFCGNMVAGHARLAEWRSALDSGKVPQRNRMDILAEALQDLRLYRKFCQTIDSLGVPVLVIPGFLDAPEERYFLFMQQAAFLSDNLILLHENTAKIDAYIFTGFGGKISENDKEDYFFLQYPRRECLFGTRRMHYLNPPRILVFHMPPQGQLDLEDGKHVGSSLVNDVIHAVAPSFLFCGYTIESPGVETIGSTVVVNPGALRDGLFAIINTRDRSADLKSL